MKHPLYDFLNWSNDKDILKLIQNETLYYINKIQKINHYNISQERILVLTKENLYILSKKKLKKKMKYNEIIGITFNEINAEFVIHGMNGEYDFYLESQEKNILICLIAIFYEEQTNLNLKICQVPDKSLKNYVTGKKEKKKGKNYTKMNENYLINTKSFIKENTRIDQKLKQISKEYISDLEEEECKIDEISIIYNKTGEFKDVVLENFQIMKILGRGAFGKVYLVQYKPRNNTYYAMKSIKKEYLNDINEINKNIIEKQILYNIDYRFLIGVNLCFTTEERIYFIMNLIHGEDLFTCIKLNNHVFDEEQIQFYASIIGLSLEYLHNNGIILKDLRLDNIIIDKDGYLKITNFKISQLFNMNYNLALMKENSEFLAPEVILSNKCLKESDWWSYGVILYQLLFGIPPFFSSDDNKLREQIINNELCFPNNSNVSQNAKNLITLLLNKNPKKRLGSNNGFEDIKTHIFFKSINFNDVINKKIKPKYKPKIGNKLLEIENYNVEFTYEDLINSEIQSN